MTDFYEKKTKMFVLTRLKLQITGLLRITVDPRLTNAPHNECFAQEQYAGTNCVR